MQVSPRIRRLRWRPRRSGDPRWSGCEHGDARLAEGEGVFEESGGMKGFFILALGSSLLFASDTWAQAAPSGADSALQFATAYFDGAEFSSAMQDAANLGVKYCQESKQITSAQAETYPSRIAVYSAELSKGMPKVQQALAESLRGRLSGDEMREAAAFYVSPAGRKFAKLSIRSLAGAEGAALAPCPNRPAPSDAYAVLNEEIYKLPTAEVESIKSFMASSTAGKLFPAVNASMTTTIGVYRNIAQQAGKKAGLVVGD